MITGEAISFTFIQILSLIGLAQCLYVLTYMLFRSGDMVRAAIPFAYFLVLGTAFFLDFAQDYIGDVASYYSSIQWLFWYLLPPMSVLLINQVAQINKLPSFPHYWVLFMIPIAFEASVLFSVKNTACTGNLFGCEIFHEWLTLFGLVAGVISMMEIWIIRTTLRDLYGLKAGKARYWLILTLVILNLFFLGFMLLGLTPYLSADDILMIRTVMGISFVYLAGTSLFRIYPQALVIITNAERKAGMSAEEKSVAQKIENLFSLDKVYHEPTYGRKELAVEVGVSEAIISKVINSHFGRTLPQIMNEHRVEDAKRLLTETDAHIKIISEEVGFNSLASFNRVFKEITGMAPSDFRYSAANS